MALSEKTGPDGRSAPDHADITGPSAAIALWKVAASVITLIAALCYGVGRILADGFYSSLNTSVGAAGVDTIAIIEPVAVFFAISALFATVILMLIDIFRSAFRWIWKHLGIIAAALAASIAIVATQLIIGYLFLRFKNFLPDSFETGAEGATLFSLVRPVWLLVRKVAARNPGSWGKVENAIDSEISEGGVAGVGQGMSSPWARLAVAAIAGIFIASPCILAHYIGVHEAGKVKKGIPVDLHVVGIDVSSIEATRVHLYPVGSSQEITSLSKRPCLLEIGSGSDEFLIYDADDNETLSVPSSEVVVQDMTTSKQCKLATGVPASHLQPRLSNP